MPDPRDPRGVRHALVVVLALTACAVLAGVSSVLAVGEWIADTPSSVLERLGIRLDPLFPKRSLPAETTVRRLLGRIDGDALDQAVGRWLADRRTSTDGQLRALAVDGKGLRGAAKATGRNPAIGALRLAGKTSIASALRHNARNVRRPLTLLELT
ncbi:transposase family protein [Streptomyces griseochromogenes]|uniref:transposase family protein n=1 Tax=Streptomyces griseochromogenes TaxID=68214 RepID=UPI00378A4724